MSFSYDINNTCNDKKYRNCLLVCHLLSTIVNMFVNTFLIAHIHSFNGNTYDYLFNVGIYNIFVYLSFFILYIPISYLVDKSNRIIYYRIGLIVKAILVIIIIFFGKELSKLLIVAGLMNGLGEALYYSSYNVVKEEMVSRKSMDSYASVSFVFSRIIEIVCPIALGAIIDVTTFSETAIIVLAISIIQVGFSFGIKSQRPEGSHFSLKEYFEILKQKNETSTKIKKIYLMSLVYGTTTLLATLINVCIMLELGSNLSLGTLTSVFAIAAMISQILIKSFSKPGKRNILYIISAILLTISAIVFVIDITIVTIIILNATIAITSVLYKYLFDLYRNKILKEAGLYDQIAEHHTIVESLINIARIATFGIVMLVALTRSMIAFKTYFLIMILLSALLHILLMCYERKHETITIEK